MFFFSCKNKEIIKKETRVILGELVKFYIVKKNYSYFFGLIQFSTKSLRYYYNKNNVSLDVKFRFDMELQSAYYHFLAVSADIMVDPRD